MLFLDFDALSLALNPPPTTRDWDKHYMCAPAHEQDVVFYGTRYPALMAVTLSNPSCYR